MLSFLFKISFFLLFLTPASAQDLDKTKPRTQREGLPDTFSYWKGDIKITVDNTSGSRNNIICFFALPNGNSTEWTMGKKMEPGDDWHFDIQHVRAQTEFIRSKLSKPFIVVYLENKQKSWPAWKQQHPDFKVELPGLIDTLSFILGGSERIVYLNGHSGGGSMIFGYLAGVNSIPSYIHRISFMDSDYGYDSSYYPKFAQWLKDRKNILTVFAYNDSVALYNGKPVVSAMGGTWYRSRLLLSHLKKDHKFNSRETDSMYVHSGLHGRARFYLKKNLNRGIYHTQQVEYNGFIHSILIGTKYESEGYEYYGPRVYSNYIR